MTLTYGSVCSGIEAATVAWHPLGWTPRFFAEIEKFPSKVLAHHFGSNMPGKPLSKNGIPNHGDFTKIESSAGPIDLLVGGTPCQSFSIAGKRLGLDDPRGNLALEYLSLAVRLGARWIVWENVPGVLSSVTDEEDGDSEARSGLEGRSAGDEWLEESDFATFLEFVRQCGYGFAYRVLDAQFTRASGYERAVPQRRRRVFLVGYLGDWRRAAAVLLDADGLRGNPPPRREAGQGAAADALRGFDGRSDARPQSPAGIAEAAPTISARPTGGGGLGTDFDLDGGLVANNRDAETEKPVAHALRGTGFDASEDGTGRRTPIVPVAGAICKGSFSGGMGGRPEGAAAGHFVPVAFNSREDPEVTFDRTGPLGSSSPQAQAVAFDMRARNGGAMPEGPHHTANIRAASGGSSRSYVAHAIQERAVSENLDNGPRGAGIQENLAYTLEARNKVQAVAHNWAVRRLTPTECERLQGFPDGWTAIPGAADGPRYKALGNSMAVNVMRAIGQRIDIVEKLIQSGALPPEAAQ